MTEGRIASISGGDRLDKNHYTLTTAFVNHGNSGGPAFDENYRVIGIVDAFMNLADVGGPGLIVASSEFCDVLPVLK